MGFNSALLARLPPESRPKKPMQRVIGFTLASSSRDFSHCDIIQRDVIHGTPLFSLPFLPCQPHAMNAIYNLALPARRSRNTMRKDVY